MLKLFNENTTRIYDFCSKWAIKMTLMMSNIIGTVLVSSLLALNKFLVISYGVLLILLTLNVLFLAGERVSSAVVFSSI